MEPGIAKGELKWTSQPEVEETLILPHYKVDSPRCKGAKKNNWAELYKPIVAPIENSNLDPPKKLEPKTWTEEENSFRNLRL